MHAKFLISIAAATLAMPTNASALAPTAERSDALTTSAEQDTVQQMIEAFVADYRNDPMALDATFGIKLGDDFWTVDVKRRETASARGRLTDHAFGPHDVTLTKGMPAKPTWYFEIADAHVLRLIASGEVNAGTAAMQSFESDKVGVETREMDGFKMTSGDEATMYFALSHFFSRGTPEVTRFGRDNALQTHGAQATALHMMKGFRISHFSIGPQEVANEDPLLQFGQMPNLFIVMKGRGTLTTDTGLIALEPGMSVFVPQFVKHELTNSGDENLEGILVLYGDNSDFAFGTSYPAFQQELNEYYRTYPFHKSATAGK